MPGIPGTSATRHVGAGSRFSSGGVTVPRLDPRAGNAMAADMRQEDATISRVQVGQDSNIFKSKPSCTEISSGEAPKGGKFAEGSCI